MIAPILAQPLHRRTPVLLLPPIVASVGEWRERVRRAELRYTRASARCCEMLTGNPLDDALEQALREEQEARAEYMHALAGLLRGDQ